MYLLKIFIQSCYIDKKFIINIIVNLLRSEKLYLSETIIKKKNAFIQITFDNR